MFAFFFQETVIFKPFEIKCFILNAPENKIMIRSDVQIIWPLDIAFFQKRLSGLFSFLFGRDFPQKRQGIVAGAGFEEHVHG